MEEGWDLLRYEKMQEYWATVAPPMDIMYAAKMGWKPDPSARKINEDSRKGDLGELIAMFSGTGGVIN